MIRLQTREIVAAIEGAHYGRSVEFAGCSIDSRTVRPGELFIALRGLNFDGHDYVHRAIAAGAAAIMTQHRVNSRVANIVVPDTKSALTDLAVFWRARFTVPLIAVTGSNGKTTVKEMISTVLSELGVVLSTKGNLNNDIGVPLTVLRLGDEHEYAVTELGANHGGEIRALSRLVRPSVGVVTQCAPAHLEGFGTIDDVAHAKGELFEALGPGTVAVINADDPFAALWRELSGSAQQLTFGLRENADVSATWTTDGESTRVVLLTPEGSAAFDMPLLGRHNVMNALASTAAALAVGASLDAVCEGLRKMTPVGGRLKLKIVHGVRVLDDSYNANPASLQAGLEVLRTLGEKRWLVLGDMAELGIESEKLHRDAGTTDRDCGVERLFGFGGLARIACESFGDGGEHFETLEALLEAVRRDLDDEPCILVKGSRSMRMERVVAALEEGSLCSLP